MSNDGLSREEIGETLQIAEETRIRLELESMAASQRGDLVAKRAADAEIRRHDRIVERFQDITAKVERQRKGQ